MKKMHKMWTKEDFKDLLGLWENATVNEMADRFDVSTATIYSIAKKFRALGYPLTKKRRNGTMDLLIREVIAESQSGVKIRRA